MVTCVSRSNGIGNNSIQSYRHIMSRIGRLSVDGGQQTLLNEGMDSFEVEQFFGVIFDRQFDHTTSITINTPYRDFFDMYPQLQWFTIQYTIVCAYSVLHLYHHNFEERFDLGPNNLLVGCLILSVFPVLKGTSYVSAKDMQGYGQRLLK